MARTGSGGADGGDSRDEAEARTTTDDGESGQVEADACADGRPEEDDARRLAGCQATEP